VERGLFRDAGLDVSLVESQGQFDAVTRLAGGQVDVALTGFNPGIANAIGRGARMRIVAARDQLKPGCSDQGALYYRKARFPQGLEQAEGWGGSRIALSSDNLMTEFYLDDLLAGKGLPSSAVEISRMRMEDAVAAAAAGRVDLFFGSARPEFLNGGLPKDVVRSDVLMTRLGGFQYTYVLYGEKLLEGDPAVGVRFLRAYLSAVRRFAAGETPQFLDQLAARMHMNPTLVKAGCRDNISTTGELRLGDIRRWMAWAESKKYLVQPVKADQIVDLRFQRALGPNQ
jgi:NitT/TauT family transport system substrate-binding protein